MELETREDQLKLFFSREVTQAAVVLRADEEEFIYLPAPSGGEDGIYGPYRSGEALVERQEGEFFLPLPAEEIKQVEVIVRTGDGSTQNLSVDFPRS